LFKENKIGKKFMDKDKDKDEGKVMRAGRDFIPTI
jgi:hypothetical protein